MTPDEASRAVTDRAYVEARYAVGGVFARGRVVAYMPEPAVLIETEDGERAWWRARLCEEVAR